MAMGAQYLNLGPIPIFLAMLYLLIYLLSPNNAIGQFEKYMKVMCYEMWQEFKIVSRYFTKYSSK